MEPIRTGLRNVMRDLLAAQPREDAALLAWPFVWGREVAAHSRAVAFAEGKLTIEVPDPNWRSQLVSLRSGYVRSMKELIGPVVREIRFVHDARRALSQTESRPH